MGYRLAITMFATALACTRQAAPPATPQRAPVAGVEPARQDRAAMIGHIVTFKMKPDREAEAVAFLAEFASQIEKQEPGTRVFYFFRSAVDPQQVIVVELYNDQAARDAHKVLLDKVRPRIAELFDMTTFKTDIQVGPAIAGMLR
jgi:quinol monooxygenase YgiN